jgi:hypothetical protein
LLARLAGSQTARNATSASTRGTPLKTSGSFAVTPNRNDVISRASPNAAARPITTPTSDSAMPWKTTMRRTCAAGAPRASRMPISCVRCSTE